MRAEGSLQAMQDFYSGKHQIQAWWKITCYLLTQPQQIAVRVMQSGLMHKCWLRRSLQCTYNTSSIISCTMMRSSNVSILSIFYTRRRLSIMTLDSACTGINSKCTAGVASPC